MTDAHLLTLPTELIHRIFSYCDTPTILLSIRSVCRHLYSIVNGYDQFELTLDSETKSQFPLICRLISPESVVTLNILRGRYGDCCADFFHSVCDICRFRRLRSLTLESVDGNDLAQFVTLLNTNKLTSLSVNPYHRNGSDVLVHITLAVEKFRIRKLCLNESDHVINQILWPADCTLTHLEIGACHYDEYITVLQGLPNLQTIVIKECVMDDKDAIIALSSDVKFISLKSLTITNFSLPAQQFESMISLTPTLVHLKLISPTYRKFDYVFDGSYWEDFIRINLSSLKKFEICFHTKTEEVADLAELIAPFRKPFWLEEKRWLVACAFIMRRDDDIWLYTLPISMDIARDPVRCEISSRDGVCRLTKRRLNQVFDTTPDKTFNTLDHHSSDIAEKEMRYLCNGLRNNTTLTTLSISFTQLGSKGLLDLANVLQNNTTLTALHLTQIQIDEIGAQYLADGLQTNTTLITLELGWNKIGPKEAYHLGRLLANNKTLIALNLQYNEIGEAGAQHLANGLRNNTKLAILELKWNSIHEHGARYLADALRDNTALTVLGLEENYIKDEGVQYIASALQHNTTLTILSLEYNGIENEGARHLADVLRHNSTLKKLYLYQNRIKAHGTKQLADALQINTTLTTFSIGWNLTGIEIAQHFADVIRHNKTLIELDIHYNDIGDNGAASIADALRHNTTLTVLDLSSNGIRSKGMKHIAGALEINKGLSAIDLCFSGMQVSDAQYIANAVRNNTTLTEVRLFDEQSWKEHRWDLDELHKQDKRLRYERNQGYRHLVERKYNGLELRFPPIWTFSFA